MLKPLPDKFIRLAIHTSINNMIVDGKTIPNYDYRANTGDVYTLTTTQSNLVDEGTRCGKRWVNSTTIEVYVRYLGSGNPGSRLLADNILDEVRARTSNLVLATVSNLEIIDQKETIPPDLVTITQTENIFRKFIRYELLIN